MSPESLQRAQHHLMAWMQLQQRTIVVNHISKVASDVAAPYKILACPVRHPSERVMGVLALVQSAERDRISTCIKRASPKCLAKRATSIIQAQYDASTGLMTRQAFERQASALLASSVDSTDTHIILYLDIDRLHVINETFGMHVGDDVIVSVAECMAKSLPRGCIVGAHFRRPACGARFRAPRWMQAAIVAEKIRAAAAAIVAARRTRLLRGVRLPRSRADRPLRQPARACTGDGRNRLQGRQGSRPQPGRNVPGFGSEHHPAAYRHLGHRQAARCAQTTTASASMRSPFCRCAATTAGRGSNC